MLGEKRYPDLRCVEEKKRAQERYRKMNEAESGKSEASLDLVKHTNPSLY